MISKGTPGATLGQQKTAGNGNTTFKSKRVCPGCGARKIYKRTKVFGVIVIRGWGNHVLASERVYRYKCKECGHEFDTPSVLKQLKPGVIV